MLFHLTALDHPNQPEKRLAHREAHLKWAAEHTDKIVSAGPLLSDDGSQMLGSMFIIEAENRAAIDAWHAEDPYVKGGVFAEVRIHAVKLLLGKLS